MSSEFFDPDDFETAPTQKSSVAQVSAPVNLEPVITEKPKFFELKPVAAVSYTHLTLPTICSV